MTQYHSRRPRHKKDILGDVEAETLLHTLVLHTLTGAKVKILGNTLGDVDCQALFHTCYFTQAYAETNPHRETVGYVQVKALLKTLAVVLERAKP